MANSDVQQAMAAAEAAELAHREVMSPHGGGDPGADPATAEGKTALGMSPDAVVPERGPLQIADDWVTQQDEHGGQAT